MEENQGDWKSIADDFITTILQTDQGGDDESIRESLGQFRERAFCLLDEVMQECDEVNQDLVISIIKMIRYHLESQNGSKCSDDCNEAGDDASTSQSEVAKFLSSQSVDESHKMKLIEFMNFLIFHRLTAQNYDVAKDEAEKIYKFLLQNQRFGHKLEVDDVKCNTFWNLILQSMNKEIEESDVIPTESTARDSSDADMKQEIEELDKIPTESAARDTSDADRIKAYGDAMSESIYRGSMFLSGSLSSLVPTLTNSIENLGDFAKRNIEPSEESVDNDFVNEPNVAITEIAVEASESFREAAKVAAHGIRDLSTQGINAIAEKWKENKLGEELCEEPELREALSLAGKVSIAALGASVNLAESIFQATKESKSLIVSLLS